MTNIIDMTNILDKKSLKKMKTPAAKWPSVDEINFKEFCWHLENIIILKKLGSKIKDTVERHPDAATAPSILSDEITHYNLLISKLNFQQRPIT